MSNPIDFSQYKRKLGNTQPSGNQNTSIDFSQYKRKPKEETSILGKAGRIATQYGLGAAENALLPYEIAVAPLASKEAQLVPYRENVMEDIERLQLQKQAGHWDDKDERLLNSLKNQIADTRIAEKFVKPIDIGVRGLTEKNFGVDLKPQGFLEKAANWAGFIKNPKNLLSLTKNGLSAKNVINAVAPTGKEALRGLGAGAALQFAEEGEFGPIGSMAALVVGDLAGGGVPGLAKGAKNLITQPKKVLAEAAARFTSKDKLALQKEIIEDFKKSGIQADLGTITDNNLFKWMQSRLAQSGLTGSALGDFKKNLTGQIETEYKRIAETLGKEIYSSSHEAGTIAKEAITKIRDADISNIRNIYKEAYSSIPENAYVNTNKVANTIKRIKSDLKPGQLKSTEQKAVLDILETVGRDVIDSSGNPMYAKIKDLINNKIALNDIINYEIQGGQKQLLKDVVAELDRAIISSGKENPRFARKYIEANRNFSKHAKTFRAKNIDQLFRAADPTAIANKMNTVQGIKELGNILNKTPEGKVIFDRLKKTQLEKIVGDNLVNSVSKQVKLGTFSKLLEKGKNREVVKELLGTESFKTLEKLQKNAGYLADSADKFYNASKSGAVAADAAVIGKGMKDIYHILSGNPWPLVRTSGGLFAAKKLSNLLADPEFLKLAEEAIKSSTRNNPKNLIEVYVKLRPYILKSSKDAREENQEAQ